jgi:hypothetical protein
MVILGAVAVIVGSGMPWVRSSSLPGHQATARGTSHAITVVAHINGRVTLTGGAAMILLALVGLITAWPMVRVLEAVAALATAAAAAYMAVRIIQRIDQVGHHLHTLRFGASLAGPIRVDYGLIVVMAGSAVCLIGALAAAARSH